MKKSFWGSRILPCFTATCFLMMLMGCETVPTPHEVEFPTAAEHLSYPKSIALLLPLKGELSAQGAAVKEGFFAAYYIDAKERSAALPKIMVIDTNNDKDVLPAYQKALSQGAEFVVGPLTKPALDILMKTGNPQVPILALNTLDTVTETGLYQFGLTPENEARQAALRAYKNGSRKALLFIQQGTWGNRVADAFSQAFVRQGGEITEVVFFTPRENMAEMVKKALHIEDAQVAAVQLAARTGQAVQFPAKARDDVDMVFMAAMPTEARQIPPMLAYYFAKSWPVYATASVYSGSPNPKLDQDLNGVTFCDIPWLVEEPQHNVVGTPDTTVQQLWPTQPRPQTRLYAMGVDAYEIIPLLQRMAVQPSYAFDGATGVLTLNDRQQVQRALPCTQFVQGVPVKLSHDEE
ncbi:MAG: penicillin-binding protein activator [Gammaproteobacteria bacterium]